MTSFLVPTRPNRHRSTTSSTPGHTVSDVQLAVITGTMNNNGEEHMEDAVEIPRELFDRLLEYFESALTVISSDEIAEQLAKDKPLRNELRQLAPDAKDN